MSNKTKTTFFASDLSCVRDLLFGIVLFGDVDGEVGFWALLGCNICCVTVSLESAGIAISGGGLRGFCVGSSIWLSSSAASSSIGGPEDRIIRRRHRDE